MLNLKNFGTLVRGEINPEGKTKDGGDYDGKFQSVPRKFSFAPETEISLVGVTLLGLHKDSKVPKEPAIVYLEITESHIFRKVKWGRPLTLLPKTEFRVFLHKGDVTTINLPFPVRVQEKVWVDIGVQIEGPSRTAIMKESVKNETTMMGSDNIVVFHTIYSQCTLQMNLIHYLI